MLNDLKFVQGAVAKKDFVPALTYFHIENGRIYGFNGTLAISTPTDLEIAATPKAASFVKAVEKIPDNEEIVLNMTAAGRISVKAGRFRAYVECHADDKAFPRVAPGGEYVPLAPGILPVLRVVAPFMGIDASRTWAMGILFKGQSAYATNNIVLIEHWLPMVFPFPMTIPSDAIREMIRIGIDPVGIQVEERAVTFHYPSGAWLRTSLYSTEWPDLSRVLDRPSNPVPFADGFFDAVTRLDAFAREGNRLYLREGLVATSPHEGDGALVELDDFPYEGVHYLNMMAKLSGVATTIDLSLWPSPCLFFGDMLRGAIIGMKC